MVSTFLSNESKIPPVAAPTYFRYQYQQTYHKYTSRSTQYNLSVISDKDKSSKNGNSWDSILKSGTLTRDDSGEYSVQWLHDLEVRSKMNEDGRGMELSDLTYYNNQLLSFDDRTGIVYEVDAEMQQVIARYILTDGNGRTNKGFKCEWSTVKDGLLYVGGLGKEWTNADGEVISQDPQYVKTIDINGRVEHMSWVNVYQSLRKETGTTDPGYLIHEAVRFNPVNRRWYFFPRRVSTEVYNDVLDERRGSNIYITANEYFEDIKVLQIGEKIESHGFSAFAFIPHRENEIVALKTSELEGEISTYVAVFDLEGGRVLLPETKIGDIKFEGVEFL